jgi:bifunctional non-homologous end joining protein LigD
MFLKEYRAKRNLKKSKEPAPKKHKGRPGKLRFVVQKHAASHLHYDFRLELDGVLKSWAIPKGPSLNPQEKRLAMMVEDHPYDYKDFEGIIPEGYGAGVVLIWDRGTYTVPEGNTEEEMRKGLAEGKVHIVLEGKKLKGEFSLVRFKGKEKEWLLIKKKDRFASDKDILKKDRSVVSNLSMEEFIEKEMTNLKKQKKKSS